MDEVSTFLAVCSYTGDTAGRLEPNTNTDFADFLCSALSHVS